MTDILGPADAINAVTSRPLDPRTWAALDSFFRDCSSPTAYDGTNITAAWLNGITAALRELWRMNGGTLADPTIKIVPEIGSNDAGLATAVRHMIQRGIPNYGADTGAADALVVSLSPGVIELRDGLVVRTKVAATNATTTPTLNVGTGGAKTIVDYNGQALRAGDLPGGSFADFRYDAIASQWRKLTPKPGFGKQIAVWSVAGTYAWTCPAGVYRTRARVKGGGGGGASVPSSPYLIYGGCGGGGGIAEGYYDVVPATTYGVVVGAGGAGQTSNSGGNGVAGGTSSFGSFLAATGGGAGLGQGSPTLRGGLSGQGSGGQINGGLGDGSTGGMLSTYNANYSAPGCGGGPGGQAGAGSGNVGFAGEGPGGGGGGTGRCEIGSTGGNGAAGEVVLEY